MTLHFLDESAHRAGPRSLPVGLYKDTGFKTVVAGKLQLASI